LLLSYSNFRCNAREIRKKPGIISDFRINCFGKRLLQSFLNSNSQVNGHTDHWQAMRRIAMEIHATCRWQVATLRWSEEKYPGSVSRDIGFNRSDYFRDSSTATARSTVMPTIGKRCKASP